MKRDEYNIRRKALTKTIKSLRKKLKGNLDPALSSEMKVIIYNSTREVIHLDVEFLKIGVNGKQIT